MRLKLSLQPAKAGELPKDIVSSVRQVAEIVSEIATASVQQANGINEINAAVAQMDEVTQQNAALVEENTAAAQSMLEQAKNLETLVGFFRMEEAAREEEEARTVSISAAKRPPSAKPAKASKKVNGQASGMRPALIKKAASGSSDAGWEEF